ncbi:hypothetical protein ACL598_02995 [Bordetella bronchialis]|uniref:hypothetical protein n=1 Tax=Bordetella bronchialis TaxID=463025 RepID=UPI003D025721
MQTTSPAPTSGSLLHQPIPLVTSSSTAGPEHDGYVMDDLDGICTALVAKDYMPFRNQFMERIRLIDKEPSGRVLFNRLAEIGTRLGVFPVLDLIVRLCDAAGGAPPSDWDALVRQAKPLVHMENGRCVWDPLSQPLEPHSPHYASQYRQVESYLIALCQQLAPDHTENPATGFRQVLADPSVPHGPSAPPPGYVALRFAPVLDMRGAAADAWPAASPAMPGAARPAYAGNSGLETRNALPLWEGRTTSLTVPGKTKLRVRVSKQLAEQMNDVRETLRTLGGTLHGYLLFQALASCAKRGETLIVAEGNGQSGLTTTRDGALVWLFDRADLSRRCARHGMYERHRFLYTAFFDLTAAQDVLGRRLGHTAEWMEGNWISGRSAMDGIYSEMKSDREPAHYPSDAGPSSVERSGVRQTYDADVVYQASVMRRRDAQRGRAGTPGGTVGDASFMRGALRRVRELIRTVPSRLGLTDNVPASGATASAYSDLLPAMRARAISNEYQRVNPGR